MSGTSLDGLDLAYCAFSEEDDRYLYDVLATETVAYDEKWKKRLTFQPNLSGYDLQLLDLQFGTWLGQTTEVFIAKHKARPDFIASHGHTWFHEPDRRLNLQLGDGFEIHRITKVPVVNDFRSLDIRLGGQGAPLVPIGDQLLFSDYDCCINLGGIANISGLKSNKRISFDIAPFNLVLNRLAAKADLEYDAGGGLAATGTLLTTLKKSLAQLPYFHQNPPKSLGIEWVSEWMFPHLEKGDRVADLLRTYLGFVSEQVVKSFEYFDSAKTMLVTGGGAKNTLFIDLLQQAAGDTINLHVPGEQLIDFKEAIVFAFLGFLRLENKVNCLKEVTGASQSVSGGVIYDQLTTSGRP